MDTRYDEFGRWYQAPDGKWCPSITTVTSLLSRDGIKKWRDEVGEDEAARISEAACARGTAMHGILESFCLGKPYPLDGEAGFLASQIIPEMEASVGKIHCVETQFWSHKLGVCGRGDLIADWNGRISAIDFKTAKKPKKLAWIDGYLLQCCFYCVAAWQHKRIRADQIVILMANNQNEPQVFVSDAKPHFEALCQLIVDFKRQIPSTHFSRR